MTTSPFPRRRLALCLTLLVASLGGPACRSRDTGIDEARARAHIDMLAGTIGSRPLGSAANARAREYLIDQLRQDGFAVRVQETDAVDEPAGLTARVFNIIALREGQQRDAIALTAHYDSVQQASGAADDALGVAVCLEAARSLGRNALRHSLLVLLTDGEETGLMGARAVVKDDEVTARMRAFLNFDSPAGAGTPLLFEVSPGLGAPLTAWAGSDAPSGASFAVEIYKRLPNDTDFTVFKKIAAGLNFSPLGDAYAYHTDRDVSRRVAAFTLRREIENTIDTVRALDATDLTAGSDPPTFSDVAGLYTVVYGSRVTRGVAWAACVGASIVWLLLTWRLWRQNRWTGLVLNPLWSAASAAAAVGASLGAAWVLRAVRAELNPWYAAPHWFYGLIAAAGLTAMWLVSRLAAGMPRRFRPPRTPVAIWWMALPLWVALTIALQSAAPGAAFLTAWPTLAAALLLALGLRSTAMMRVASVAVLAMVAGIWADKLATLAAFLVPLSGWLGIVMPVWVFAAVVIVGGVMCLPPVGAAIAGWQQRPASLAGVAVLPACLVVFGLLAYFAPAYTADRPERRTLRYVQDDTTHQAWWAMGSPEPRPDLGRLGLSGANWQRATSGPPAAVRVAQPGGTFRFRSPAAPLVARPPADARSTVSSSGDGRRVVKVSIVPHENMAVRVALPGGRVPIASTWAGRVVDGEWSAAYAAPPLSGIDMQMTFDAASGDQLPIVVVVLTVPGLPRGVESTALPSLAQERATWDARSIYLLDASASR